MCLPLHAESSENWNFYDPNIVVDLPQDVAEPYPVGVFSLNPIPKLRVPRQPAERQSRAGRAVIAAVVQLGALSHSGTQGSAHSPAGCCFAPFPRGKPCRDRGVSLDPSDQG